MTARSLLMLASESGVHAKRSGYTVLADYIQEARLITTVRSAPKSLAKRLGRAAAARAAVTDWYQLGSIELERQAWKARKQPGRPILHFLWADNDLGILDLLSGRDLCCTFHQPPDVLKAIIRHPGRLKNLGGIILMSLTQRHFFSEHGVSDDRIHVVLHGVDTEFFQPGPGVPQERFTVLSVGSYRRNFQLLRSVAQHFSGDPDIRFQVVAAEGYRATFADCPGVQFLSGISDLELLSAYRSAGCFLMTAPDATANNALLEAMACGVPIVAEQAGGIPEYVTQDCATLVPPDNPAAIAAAIRHLMASPESRGRMGAASRERALQLDWNRVAGRMRQVYNSMGQRP